MNYYKTNTSKLAIKQKLIKAIEKDIQQAKEKQKFYNLTITCLYYKAKASKNIIVYNTKASKLENFINSISNKKIIDYVKSENKQKLVKINSLLASENLINRIEKVKAIRKSKSLLEKVKENKKAIALQQVKLYNIAKNNSYCLNYEQYKQKQKIIAYSKLEKAINK